jgi:hypothetical protein
VAELPFLLPLEHVLNNDFRVGLRLVQPGLNTISESAPHMQPDWEPAASQQQANVFPNLVTLRVEPMWDPLRSDPRFEDLVRRMHFPP